MRQRPSDGFGRRLARYRRLAGLSAQQLSDKLDGELSRGVIANIESGRKTDITIDQWLALSWVLQIPPIALALPLERPFEWLALTRGHHDQAEWATTGTIARWMVAVPQPFEADKGEFNIGPAGIVARELLKAQYEYDAILEGIRVRQTTAVVAPSPDVAEQIARLTAELERCKVRLESLGVDMTPPVD